MEYVTAFNILTQEFINKLIDTFPEDRDFKIFNSGFKLMIRINKKKSVLFFKQYVEKYRDYILNKDDNYFMKNNSTDLMADNGYTDTDTDNNFILINKLKNYWIDLSENNKNVSRITDRKSPGKFCLGKVGLFPHLASWRISTKSSLGEGGFIRGGVYFNLESCTTVCLGASFCMFPSTSPIS